MEALSRRPRGPVPHSRLPNPRVKEAYRHCGFDWAGPGHVAADHPQGGYYAPAAAPVTVEELAELHRLAEAATPGPWEAQAPRVCCSLPNGELDPDCPWNGKIGEAGGIMALDTSEDVVPWYTVDLKMSDAAYIAAANPEAILRLLATVEGLKLGATMQRRQPW